MRGGGPGGEFQDDRQPTGESGDYVSVEFEEAVESEARKMMDKHYGPEWAIHREGDTRKIVRYDPEPKVVGVVDAVEDLHVYVTPLSHSSQTDSSYINDGTEGQADGAMSNAPANMDGITADFIYRAVVGTGAIFAAFVALLFVFAFDSAVLAAVVLAVAVFLAYSARTGLPGTDVA